MGTWAPRAARRGIARALAVVCAAGGVVSMASWYGCSVYGPSLLASGAPDAGDAGGGGPDGATGFDATTDQSSPGPEGGRDAGPKPDSSGGSCPRTPIPPPPSADDPNDGGQVSILLAMRTFVVGVNDAGTLTQPTGYDLDGVYTCCDGGPESCKPPVTGATHCDAVGGKDDSAGALLGTLQAVDPGQFSVDSINQRIEKGDYTILLQLLNYNGTLNDTTVTAAVYGSDGIQRDGGPLWNGNDPWSVDTSFVASPDASTIIPNHIDGNAYVADGVFVVHVDFPLALGSGQTLPILLSPGIATGTLIESGSGYKVDDGIIAGRWSVKNLLSSVQTVHVMGQTVCPGSQLFNFVKTEVCQYADLASDPSNDNTGAACDALSVGVGFSGQSARFGTVTTGNVTPPLCGDGAVDPGPCGQ